MSRAARRPKQEGDVRTSGVRIGPEFQADIPALIGKVGAPLEHRAELLFEPDPNSDEFPSADIKKSLGNPAVRWTADEKANFKKCFSRHKKKFNRYRDLLPGKSIVQLLDYYYSTKIREVPEPPLSRDPDYSPGRVSPKKNGRSYGKKVVCNAAGRVLFSRRVDSPPEERRLRFSLENLEEVIGGEDSTAQLEDLTSKVERLREELADGRVDGKDLKQVEMYRRLCNSSSWLAGDGLTGTPWTDSELILAVHSIRVYGKDFKAVARLIGNKTEAQVRLFFANYRERYNLELMVRQFEEDRRNGRFPRGNFALMPTQETDSLSPTSSPVKKLLRSPLKKPSILSRRRI